MPDPFAAEAAAIAEEAQLAAAGVAVHDFAAKSDWDLNGDRWFHAASTIKVAVLVAVAAAAADGRFQLGSRLAVRNRFLSAADGSPFRISPTRDANAEVHAHIGRTMRLEELAQHMIATSSNLATNLLLDLVGVDYARSVLARLGVDGVDLRRGVEDEKALAAGIMNRVTARGLVQLFCAIHERRIASLQEERRAVPPFGERRVGSLSQSQWMLHVLQQQAFTNGIPAGLPESVRAQATVANKTGEISNMSHDAGLVFLPDETVYAVAVLTETPDGVAPTQQTVARLARVAYDQVIAARVATRQSQ
jgi:beta-lactamase class A